MKHAARAHTKRARFAARLLRLQEAVDLTVRVQQHRRTVRDEQPRKRRRIELLELRKLLKQRRDVHDDAIANQVLG